MDVSELEFETYAEELYPPTESWEITASFRGMTVRQLMHEALFTPTQLKIVDVPGKGHAPDIRANAMLIPGHGWLEGGWGPTDAEVLIVGKHPSQDEVMARRNFTGASGRELRKVLTYLNVDYSKFYVTNVVKFLPPDAGNKFPARFVADCGTLLAHEVLSLQRLKYILLLGAEAIKFFFGNKATLSNTRGALFKFAPWGGFGRFPDIFHDDTVTRLVESKLITVMTTMHPAYILRKPELASSFQQDIARFAQLVRGEKSAMSNCPATITDYRYIRDADTLNKLVDELIAAGNQTFAIDCEWGGEHFMSGWLRTVQFSWAPGKAAVVILRDCEHQRDPVFQPSLFAAVEALRRLFDRPDVKIWGQLIRSDAVWLESLGVPIMRHLAFDVGQADHALNESLEHDLTALTLRYAPDMGRYDVELTQWVKTHTSPDGGYGHVPDNILHPYAAADADAVFRIAPVIMALLERPENALLANNFYQSTLPANHGIHEIEMNGVLVDPTRMVDLLWKYTDKKQQLLDELREMISWPDFNPRSTTHKADLLFGKAADGGFELMPIKSTGKPAREWQQVLAEPPEVQARMRPSTDAESLDLLAINATAEHQIAAIEKLQDFQRIDQMTKNFLRPPGGADLDLEHDHIEYEQSEFTEGLVGHIQSDNRIHTSISQLKETGRWGSRRPNLQNLSKRMESFYKVIMGDDVLSLRSCIVAPPGHVLIESDFKSAEIVALAYVSGDKQLIIDATGPIKLHAKVAVDTFKAPSTYKDVNKTHPHLYVAAKNINFGIPYQRGAKAIARQILRETKGKVRLSTEETQEFIDNWYERYPGVTDYIQWCKFKIRHDPHCIWNPWGRCRHFYMTDVESANAAQEREGINYTIQSLVAGALDRAVFNLWSYRKQTGMKYRLVLGIHDAVLTEVPFEEVEHFMDVALPLCMVHGTQVPAGERNVSFKLDIDPEIMFRWSEHPSRKEMENTGIPERFWPADK